MKDKTDTFRKNIPGKPPSKDGYTMEEYLFRECLSMAKFALSKGIKVPAKVVGIINKYERIFQEPEEVLSTDVAFDKLNYAHDKLADLIDPIRPGTCHLIVEQAEKNSFWNIFGAVPMARRMAGIAFFSLIAMLAISLSKDVSGEYLAKGILNNHGWILLQTLIFLLSTASLGSSFALLFKINRELENGGYEQDDNASYIANWIMGIAAGMILAEMIPVDLIVGSGTEASDANAIVNAAKMSKLVLALLGGFASSLVYNILNTFVDALGSAFKKDNRDDISEECKKMRSELNRKVVVSNLKLANRLNRLKQSLKEGKAPESLDQEIERMVQQLLGEDMDEDD